MKQIVIISGKGGTGKTVITAAFASLAKNKVMVDCDVDAADLYLLLHPEIQETHKFIGGKEAIINQEKCSQCGKCFDVCRFNAISYQSINSKTYQQIMVDPISCEGCGVCVWNCPMDAIEFKEKISGEWFLSETKYGPFVHAKLCIAEENSGKLVSLVRQKAKEIAEKENKDYVIIDGPPGIGCPVISSLSGVDCALVVTEPTLSGLHDAIRVIDVAKHFGVVVNLVINKYDLNIEMSKKIEKYCKDNKINMAGKIVYDSVVTESIANKKTIIEYSDGEVTRQIKNLWKIIKEVKNG